GSTDRTAEGTAKCKLFFFSSRRRHTRSKRDWSSDVCSSDLQVAERLVGPQGPPRPRPARGQKRALGVLRRRRRDRRAAAARARRSEERRVGKECGAQGWAWYYRIRGSKRKAASVVHVVARCR